MDAEPRVLLVTLPWSLIRFPSIQLGTLKSVLRRDGIAARVRYLNLAFVEHIVAATADRDESERITTADGARLGELQGVGDWVFAVPPFRSHDAAADASFLASKADFIGSLAPKLYAMRELAAGFLERCVDEVIAAGYQVIGITSSFNQNVASLAFAKLLKTRAPNIAVVFGGANCDGSMGSALHAAYPFIDAVVRGEGERVAGPVFADLLAGRPVRELPGVCTRRDGRSVAVPFDHELVDMNEVPAPDYDEYFEALADSPLRGELEPEVRILYESARGCWWGEKNHCTFCGLNGSSMRFRSKDARLTFREMTELGRRHRNLHFQVVDNIIELTYLDELLPSLRDTGWDWDVFYETKANLKRPQLQLFRDAGVKMIQPGIESLSTPILRLMNKGVTALQNIRLLKWCAELDIQVTWNLIYGFPGEDPAEYAAMAELIPSLTHLQAPNASPLSLERFSPYQRDPARYGIEVAGAASHYKALYSLPPDVLEQIAYAFEFRHVDGREPIAYAGAVVDAIASWKASDGARTLLYDVGPGYLTIDDQRPDLEPARFTFGDCEALIYLACDAGATVAQVDAFIRSRGHDDLDAEEIAEFLDKLVELRLAYRERGKYLALAIARDRNRAASRLGIAELDAEQDRDSEADAVTAGLVRLRRAAAP